MKTVISRVDANNPNRKDMEMAGQFIASGELVAFPTETVYGLGGDALDSEASKKIYAAKGRPSDNPLIVHIADFSGMEILAESVGRKEAGRCFLAGTTDHDCEKECKGTL